MTKLAYAVLALCFAVAVAANAAPAIHVEEPIYDFGEVVEGYAVEHTFTIQNIGNEVLEINKVRASCGCTTTELETDRLAPGQSVTLGVLVNTTAFGGRISKSIYVYANDPNYADSTESSLPTYTLKVTGVVTRAQEYNMTTYDLSYNYYVLIDVRGADAYASGHILGAINLPFAELDGGLDTLPSDAWLILYDQDGTTGAAAAQTLIASGFSSAWYLLGGMSAWHYFYGSDYITPAQTPSEGVNPGAVACNAGDLCMRPQLFHDNYFMLIIDQRSADSYVASHLLGAVNVPQAQVEQWLNPFPRDMTVVLYDQGNVASDAVVETLALHQFTNAWSLLGGFDEWVRQFGDRYVVTAD
ncbi:DUF1573 domain-containing protein [Candidatus Bipolaricaulota bacterium]|nr:DUF1573 domain-containing protein [Candidatus Bipolaricaulota bacterium]